MGVEEMATLLLWSAGLIVTLAVVIVVLVRELIRRGRWNRALEAINRDLTRSHADAQKEALRWRARVGQVLAETRYPFVSEESKGQRFAANLIDWAALDAKDCPDRERDGEAS